MKILPPSLERHVYGIDRQRSLAIGIGTGLVAFWSAYRVIWALYLSFTYDFLFGSLVFSIALWGVIGAVAGIAAAAFLTRYFNDPAAQAGGGTQPLNDPAAQASDANQS
jgi:hypothetical protein